MCLQQAILHELLLLGTNLRIHSTFAWIFPNELIDAVGADDDDHVVQAYGTIIVVVFVEYDHVYF